MGWCVLEDFNEVLANDEKVRGRPRCEKQMEMFRRVLEEGNLFDLGWNGAKFTWYNRHGDASFMKERLDRLMANIALWVATYSE